MAKKKDVKKKKIVAAPPRPKYNLKELPPSEMLKPDVGYCLRCKQWKPHKMNKGMGLCKLSNAQVGFQRTKANMVCDKFSK